MGKDRFSVAWLLIGLAVLVALVWLLSLGMETPARRAAVEIQLTRAAIEAEDQATVSEATRPARIMAGWIVAVGLSLAVVALAFAGVALVSKWAWSVYPNDAGQYPVIIWQGWGWRIMHDANRGLGPTAVYLSPVARLDARLAPGSDFPQPADEGTMERITSHAQAVQLMTASRGTETSREVVAAAAGLVGGGDRGRVPERVEVVEEDLLLLEEGDGG